jgi:3-phosphoglycerate kinase
MGTGSIKENVMLRWMLFFCLVVFWAGLSPLAASAGKAQTDNLRGKMVDTKPVQKDIKGDLEEGPGDGGNNEETYEVSSSEESGPLPDNGAAAVKNKSDAQIYEGKKDGGTKGMTGTFRTVDGLISVIEKKNIEDVQVATDWNLPKKKDGSFDVKRLKNSVRDQKKLIQESKAKYFYIFTHYDRPEKGKGYQLAYDMEGILNLAREEYAAAGLDVEVLLVSNPTSVDAKGQYDNNLDMAKQFIAEAKKRFPNKKIVFVYNNVRNYAEEQSDDAAVRAKFEKQLIAATGVPVMEAGPYYSDKIAFYNIGGDKIHRDTDASVEQGQLIAPENRAAGQGIITTMDQVNFFQKNVKRYSVIGGGKKFDKFVALSRIAALADKTEGFAAIFGALGNEVSARLFGVPVGSSLVANKSRDKESRKGN